MAKIYKTDQSSARAVRVNELDAGLNCTHIIHGQTRRHFAEWAGHLSLKSFTKGRAFYNAGAGFYAVDDDSYLILNELQPYQITIDSETEIESFCIFFETGFAEKVSRSLTSKTVQLLDDPERSLTAPINFVQKLYPRRPLENLLSELRSLIGQGKYEQVWLKEKLHLLMQELLQARQDTLEEIEQIPALRASTREELYRRVYRARDFIAASWNKSVTLDEMAKIACLSTNHFLRTFKQVFSCTPHQYLTALRLRQAEKLLRQTDLSVIDVCQSVGFESHSSFSSLFRRHSGLSPEQYRRSEKR